MIWDSQVLCFILVADPGSFAPCFPSTRRTALQPVQTGWNISSTDRRWWRWWWSVSQSIPQSPQINIESEHMKQVFSEIIDISVKLKGFIIKLFPRYFWLGQNSINWDLLGGMNENFCQDWTEYALFALSWWVPKRCRSEDFCWRFLTISQNDAFSLNQHLVCVCGFIWLCWFDMAHVVYSTF